MRVVLGIINDMHSKVYCWQLSQPPFPYRNKYMEINFDSAAAMPIINVPAKKSVLKVHHSPEK